MDEKSPPSSSHLFIVHQRLLPVQATDANWPPPQLCGGALFPARPLSPRRRPACLPFRFTSKLVSSLPVASLSLLFLVVGTRRLQVLTDVCKKSILGLLRLFQRDTKSPPPERRTARECVVVSNDCLYPPSALTALLPRPDSSFARAAFRLTLQTPALLPHLPISSLPSAVSLSLSSEPGETLEPQGWRKLERLTTYPSRKCKRHQGTLQLQTLFGLAPNPPRWKTTTITRLTHLVHPQLEMVLPPSRPLPPSP